MLFAAAVLVEDNIGDLQIFAIHFVGVLGDGVDLHGLAIGIALAGIGEGGFASAKLLDDLLGRDAAGRRGIERAEAGDALRLAGRICYSGEGVRRVRR